MRSIVSLTLPAAVRRSPDLPVAAEDTSEVAVRLVHSTLMWTQARMRTILSLTLLRMRVMGLEMLSAMWLGRRHRESLKKARAFSPFWASYWQLSLGQGSISCMTHR